MVSALVSRSSVRVRVLAGDIALWHFTLTVPHPTQARVVRKVDNAMHWINHYPAESVVCFVNTYPLSDSVIQPLNNWGQVGTGEYNDGSNPATD